MNNLFKKGFASLALASAMTSSIFAGAADIHFKPLYFTMGDDGNQSISNSFGITVGPAGAVKFVSSNDAVGNNTVMINLKDEFLLTVEKSDYDKPVFTIGKVDALAVIKTPLSQLSGATDDKMHVLKTGWEHLAFSSIGKGLSFSVFDNKPSVVANFVAGQAINKHIVEKTDLTVLNIGKGLSFSVFDNKPSVVATSPVAIKTAMTDTNNTDANIFTSSVTGAGSNISFAESFSAGINKYANNTIENGKKDNTIEKSNDVANTAYNYNIKNVKINSFVYAVSTNPTFNSDKIGASLLAFHDGDKKSNDWLVAA